MHPAQEQGRTVSLSEMIEAAKSFVWKFGGGGSVDETALRAVLDGIRRNLSLLKNTSDPKGLDHYPEMMRRTVEIKKILSRPKEELKGADGDPVGGS